MISPHSLDPILARIASGVWMMGQADFSAFLARIVHDSAITKMKSAAVQSAAADKLMPWDMPGAFPTPSNVDGVAIIPISGTMDFRLSNFEMWWYGLADTARIEEWVATAANDPNVKAILLDVNSPGGNAQGVPELASTIAAARNVKPVLAFTDSIMASAAYYAAAGAHAIYGTGSSTVGSIGSYIAIYDYTKMLADWGIELQLFKSGPLKGAGIMGKPLSDEQKAHFQEQVDRHAGAFKSFVTANRPAVSDAAMQGQTFFGTDAKDVNLLDSIAKRSAALKDAKTLALARR